ncbi:MAG TPA: TIGR03085 family metal-binding protein [Actinospica sp.]|jgi:uncharacterized protein (TIGR03085 family)|nr:TIGR03085 family metal-binding protein [Actinospica sp.]
MTGFAARERQALAECLATVGPDAPTLCEGWRTADLTAHLVVRESRPDAALGIVAAPVAGWTKRVQDGSRDRTPYPELVERFRSGPPVWSPTRLGAVAKAANTMEFFVHHEDVRRAAQDWQPRELDAEDEDELWRRLRSGVKLSFRKVPVGVTLVRTPQQQTVVAKAATPLMVTVSGQAGELVMFAMGRQRAARVELSGDDAAVEKLRQAKLGI